MKMGETNGFHGFNGSNGHCDGFTLELWQFEWEKMMI